MTISVVTSHLVDMQVILLNTGVHSFCENCTNWRLCICSDGMRSSDERSDAQAAEVTASMNLVQLQLGALRI